MSIRDELAALLREHAMPSQEADFPADEYECYECCADVILDRFAVVELPEGEQDDDGQTWYADYEIRVDHTGMSGPEAYLDMNPVSAAWLRGQASEYLAAARDLEARS